MKSSDTLIFHAAHAVKYTVIANATICDANLSWKARGILAYLLSKPGDWKVIVSHLETQSNEDGKASVVAGLAELERHFYLRKTRRPKIKGQFDGWDVEVFEEPYKTPGQTASDFPHLTASDFPPTDNQPLLSTDRTTTELQNKEEFSSISEPVNMAEIKARRQRVMPSLNKVPQSA